MAIGEVGGCQILANLDSENCYQVREKSGQSQGILHWLSGSNPNRLLYLCSFI